MEEAVADGLKWSSLQANSCRGGINTQRLCGVPEPLRGRCRDREGGVETVREETGREETGREVLKPGRGSFVTQLEQTINQPVQLL